MFKLVPVLLTATVSTLVAVLTVNAEAALIAPATEGPATRLTSIAEQSMVPPRQADLGTVSRRVIYCPAGRVADAGRVLPDWLTAPAALRPTGSLSWAGIQEAAAMIAALPEQPRNDSDRRGSPREVVATESPNLDLLTAIPAPEPPAIVMLGFALAAGGLVWTQNRRRTRAAA